MKKIILFSLSILVCLSAKAQYLTNDKRQGKTQKAQTVTTIKGITGEMLNLISGPKGKERDWTTFRNLFLPSAQFYALPSANQPKGAITALNLEEFIRTLGPIYKAEGFSEKPLDYDINEFNGMANVFQSYEAKNASGTYQARGINNFILMWNDNRWWIASVTWSNEDSTHPIPDELGSAGKNEAPQKPKGKLDKIKKGTIKLN